MEEKIDPKARRAAHKNALRLMRQDCSREEVKKSLIDRGFSIKAANDKVELLFSTRKNVSNVLAKYEITTGCIFLIVGIIVSILFPTKPVFVAMIGLILTGAVLIRRGLKISLQSDMDNQDFSGISELVKNAHKKEP